MKSVLLICYLWCQTLCVHAQEYTRYDLPEQHSKLNLGLGIGLDYGGIGGRITFLPTKRLAVFGGIGYALVDFGYNVGAQVRFAPDNKFCPTFGVMYGYNGVIKVQNAAAYDKIYYGTSLSGGMEFHFGGRANFMNLELVVPFRPKAFHDRWNSLKQQPNISIAAEPLPIAFSIGYHFTFK
ncbi:hypothetical protein [Chryseolinea sp. H1M3-3]|uniref:hypothetical protein n=1 Tax=Chryseolinea sp. H1M3-3 TaxID=3034144 RepID=UPI0023EA9F92|nr:hypothetical protein [Chryseolinea sp. H1M3-3]